LIEGCSPEEILALPREQIEALVFAGAPIVFKVGSAEVLGEFRLLPDRLVLELAQIEGGGEGVLLRLWALTERYAALRGLSCIEWIVHAINCAKPNLKLRRVLERRGFTVQEVPGVGSAYRLLHQIREGPASDLRP
jgi:hypothetical protein